MLKKIFLKPYWLVIPIILFYITKGLKMSSQYSNPYHLIWYVLVSLWLLLITIFHNKSFKFKYSIEFLFFIFLIYLMFLWT